VGLPEAFSKAENQPQYAVFRMGATEIVVKDFVPSDFSEGTLQTLMLSLYGLAAGICLHGPALLLRGKGDIVTVTKLALLYYFSGWLLGCLWVVIAALLLIDLLHLRGWSLYGAWIIVVVIPFYAVLLRSYFAAFSEYYSFSKKRLFVASVGGAVISSVLSPLLFMPILYLIIRFEPLWKTIL